MDSQYNKTADTRKPEGVSIVSKMAFGITASPFLLLATITHHLDQHLSEFTNQLEKDLYVDNLITTVPDPMTV
jgi:hypothetical protein